MTVQADGRPKDPSRVARGVKGMRSRWGPPRILRLDALTAPQRLVILGIIDVFRSEADKPAGQE
jgi:hypothetical protein